MSFYSKSIDNMIQMWRSIKIQVSKIETRSKDNQESGIIKYHIECLKTDKR